MGLSKRLYQTKAILVVLNPAAGGYRPEYKEQIREHLTEVHNSVEIIETTGSDQNWQTFCEKLENDQEYQLVVAAGGDGTVSLVANSLVRSTQVLGILPLGTGNTLAQDLGIPLDISQALELITGESNRMPIDGMQVGERFFILNISLGLSSLMIQHTDQEQKQRFGSAAYIWNGIRKLFGHQPYRFEVEVDGKVSEWRAAEVMITNSGIIGEPPLRWSKQVKLDDGELNVWIVRSRSLADYLRLSWSLLWGRQQANHQLHQLITTEQVSVRTSSRLPVQADGDFIGWPPVEITLVPGAIHVLIPPEASGVDAGEQLEQQRSKTLARESD